MNEKQCPICHKTFMPRTNNQICCCSAHGNVYRSRRAWQNKKPVERKCKYCGKMFIPTAHLKSYCSTACQTTRLITPLTLHKCPICEEDFYGRRDKIYCGEECSRIAHTLRKGYNSHHPIPKKIPEKHLDESIAASNTMGMSYGKYKAMLWMEANKYR